MTGINTLKTHLDTLNPMYYQDHPKDYPEKYIDHFDKTPRQILCISDGREELEWLTATEPSNPLDYSSATNIADVDDFTYYLKELVEGGLLKAGRIYTLIDADIEPDVEFGMAKLKELEGKGIPAFLFEEMEPKSVDERRRNIQKYWKAVKE